MEITKKVLDIVIILPYIMGMSRVYMAGDPHFGHKNIVKYVPELGLKSLSEYEEYVIMQWNSIITKHDLIFVLGDALFNIESFENFSRLKGRKILVRGNHDRLKTAKYMELFDEIEGILRYKSAWLTHAPIHPRELRGLVNIHGHVHRQTVPDSRYYNACIEHHGFKPVEFKSIIEKMDIDRKENHED